MGLSFESIAFRLPQNRSWDTLQPWLTKLFSQYGISAEELKLTENKDACSICTDDPFRQILNQQLLTRLSAITGDYVVGASCVDSDFILMVLLCNGQEIDSGTIGENYFAEEMGEESTLLTPEKWFPLLKDPEDKEKLTTCFTREDYVFIEEAARELQRLTGLPVIDYTALFGEEF